MAKAAYSQTNVYWQQFWKMFLGDFEKKFYNTASLGGAITSCQTSISQMKISYEPIIEIGQKYCYLAHKLETG
jgi:hypothetical protein